MDLSILTVVGIRIIPLANLIISSITTIKFGVPSLDIVADEFANNHNKDNGKQIRSIQKDSWLIESIIFKNVEHQYDKPNNFNLGEISLSIPAHSFTGFVGTTGAGKTTLIDLILGLLIPTKGKVLVDGHNIQENLSDWQRQIGYIPQNIYLSDETIRENIAFGIDPEDIDEKAVLSALELAQLDEFVETLPEGLNTSAGERGIRLSGGQRQRIGIARALYRNPSLIVMDEATASLDNETESEIIREEFFLFQYFFICYPENHYSQQIFLNPQ